MNPMRGRHCIQSEFMISYDMPGELANFSPQELPVFQQRGLQKKHTPTLNSLGKTPPTQENTPSRTHSHSLSLSLSLSGVNIGKKSGCYRATMIGNSDGALAT